MSGTFIFVIMVVAGLIWFLTGLVWLGTVGTSAKPDVPGLVPATAGIIALIGMFWLLAASQHNKIVEREIVSTSTTVSDVQCVIFVDGEDTYHYNLNKKFGRTFEDGTEFKLMFYSDGPYAGLYIGYTEKMEQVE